MKSKMTNRNKTFWIIAILVIALFFTFNTLPMIKGVIYSFTNYKGYGSYDVVGWPQSLLQAPRPPKPCCSSSSCLL